MIKVTDLSCLYIDKSDSSDSYEMDEELGKCFKMTMVPFYVFTRGKLVGWFFKKFSFYQFLTLNIFLNFRDCSYSSEIFFKK